MITPTIRITESDAAAAARIIPGSCDNRSALEKMLSRRPIRKRATGKMMITGSVSTAGPNILLACSDRE